MVSGGMGKTKRERNDTHDESRASFLDVPWTPTLASPWSQIPASSALEVAHIPVQRGGAYTIGLERGGAPRF
jgi:hypothetical protein